MSAHQVYSVHFLSMARRGCIALRPVVLEPDGVADKCPSHCPVRALYIIDWRLIVATLHLCGEVSEFRGR